MQPPLSFTRRRASARLGEERLDIDPLLQRREHLPYGSLIVWALLDRLFPGGVGLAQCQHGEDRRMTSVRITIGCRFGHIVQLDRHCEDRVAGEGLEE